MGYIPQPDPDDDEIIYEVEGGEAYTWGAHRAMEKALKEMERDNHDVLAARQRLDEVLQANGFSIDDWKSAPLVCEFCGKTEYVRHDPECRMYEIDKPVTREAGGYQYYDQYMELVHTTSSPLTDEEAFDHFRIVQLMFPREEDFKVKFIFRREMHETEYKMMPVTYDPETKEVTFLNGN